MGLLLECARRLILVLKLRTVLQRLNANTLVRERLLDGNPVGIQSGKITPIASCLHEDLSIHLFDM